MGVSVRELRRGAESPDPDLRPSHQTMIDADGLDLIDPQSYAAKGYPHDTWARLRRESPVHRCEPPGYPAFWAVTKHTDVALVSKHPETFRNAPGVVMLTAYEVRRNAEVGGPLDQMKSLIETDPPRHRGLRRVASAWFTPNSLKRLDGVIRESARALVDELAREGEGECDFATDVAARHPLRILARILGVPREEEPYILRATNELFGGEDPEFGRDGNGRRSVKALGRELYAYFEKIIADRRAHPRDDLASVLANATLDGRPLGDVETFGYYLITFTAGHETTRNAITGGMLALIEHPEELERLRRDPSLLPSAVEEIVRWTTPVNYMMRTADRDTELRGRTIRAGDKLLLFYASANRDEEIFGAPTAFRVDRHPNPHLGFGIGEHFCLGAHLARASQRALFRELVTRLESVELAGAPQRLASSFVAGIKHLPVRYRASR